MIKLRMSRRLAGRYRHARRAGSPGRSCLKREDKKTRRQLDSVPKTFPVTLQPVAEDPLALLWELSWVLRMYIISVGGGASDPRPLERVAEVWNLEERLGICSFCQHVIRRLLLSTRLGCWRMKWCVEYGSTVFVITGWWRARGQRRWWRRLKGEKQQAEEDD